MKKYTHRKVKRKGKLDGRDFKWALWPFHKNPKDSYPPVDQKTPAMFESELFEVGQKEIISLTAEWKDKDKEYKAEYCRILHHIDATEENLAAETKDVTAAKEVFQAAQNKLNEFEAPDLSKRAELLLLFIIGIVELPLNSIAFQIFGAGKIETFIMAFAMCLSVPFFGFWIGRKFKQTSKTLTDKLFLTLSCIVIFGLIISLAIFREVLFETMQSHSILKINLSPRTAAFLFIIINTVLVLAAILVTYSASHRNHAEYSRVYKIFRIALKNLRKESREAEVAAKEAYKAAQLAADRRQRRQKIHDTFYQNALEIKEKFEWLIRSYRTANMYARPRGGTPVCFNDAPSILTMPEELLPENLDWNCPESSRNGNGAGMFIGMN